MRYDPVKQNMVSMGEVSKNSGYQPDRVIWITLLNGQRIVKFNLLDEDGNVLYRIERKSNGAEEIENNITFGTIIEIQIKEIQQILARNEPCCNWYDDDLEGTLEYFGYEIARLDDLMRNSRKYNELVVDYDIYSNYEEDEEGNEIEELTEINYHELGTITKETIEDTLVQKPLQHKEWDTIEMKIIENGQIDSYLLEFEEREE